MLQTRRIWVGLLLLAFTGGAALAAAGPQLSAEQQQAADKLKAKGGSVMQLAADSGCAGRQPRPGRQGDRR